MASLRPLFPKVDLQASISAPAGSESSKASKRKLTPNACLVCRQKKTKCDGVRPSCKTCRDKSLECTYPDDDVQLRASRLASYECFVGTLRDGSEADAEVIVHRLRHTPGSDEDLANRARLKALHDFVKRLQVVPENEAADLVTRLRSGEVQDDLLHEACSSVHSDEHQRHSVEGAKTVRVATPKHRDDAVGRDFSSAHVESEPVVSSDELNQRSDILYSWNRMSVADTTRIQTAVKAFFESSEHWFLVFTNVAITRYHRDVYLDNQGLPQAVKQAELCCLCAAAAVGMHILPLDAIKICTLLANFNIKKKRANALAFVEIGLSLCLKHNLNDDNVREPGMTEDTWLNYRKTWRALLYQSVLLSSTLGYVFGSALFFEEMPLSGVALETVSMLPLAVSRELTKLCLLKANISRMDFTLKGQAGASPKSLGQDLQQWYRQLPKDLYLAALIEEQAIAKRVSIYYVNLMFLSAKVLLYRRTAGRYLRTVGFVRRDATSGDRAPSNYVFDNATEGVLAAQQSARIFKLLVLENVSVWKCWLVMFTNTYFPFLSFQAYTTCTILLHAVLQHQIHGDATEFWQANLEHARSCLAVLERCRTGDSTISHLHAQLAALFGPVASFQPSQPSTKTAPHAPMSLAANLLTLPEDAQDDDAMAERIWLSMDLLVRLCGPFENLGEHSMLEAHMNPSSAA
ncbi:hypothetical protein PG991_009354 [Apiospora marii]|uniref:Zn(2)-C6 fungal-type domain-containing protein n=1 Tax=Apiospora marii TaxID=335849 RepID=A0ABR1RLQ5_9PEZI